VKEKEINGGKYGKSDGFLGCEGVSLFYRSRAGYFGH